MKRRILVAVLVTSALLIGVVGAGTAVGYKGKGTEGCTPGYWKQPHHADSWNSYTPNQTFKSAFDGSTAFGDTKTLLQVLSQGGGGLTALGRHAVAALLNASSSGVDFYWDTDDVIDAFNMYYASDPSGLKGAFETENEKGCPLN